MEAQYGKFLNMICAVRINVPLINVLAGLPNYGKFLKELVNNKHKIKQISATFLSDESSVMIQNKVPPKLRDPESFLIPCNFNKTFSCNALTDLGASINLMPYSLYAKLSLKTLKPTKMSDEGRKTFIPSKEPFSEIEIFAEFDEFMAMTANENSNSESGTEDPPFQKITINTDYKIKTSLKNLLQILNLTPFLIIWNMYSLKNPLFFLLSYHLSYPKKEDKLRFVLKKHTQGLCGKRQ
ncbi:reverse transcriptase domain-containing protein [Tanacetum coccineum]